MFLIKTISILIVICISIPYSFADAPDAIKLSEPDLERGKLLMQAFSERKSMRSFSERELPEDVLSNLLWAAAGINRPGSGMRTNPTAHNWQEILVYVAKPEGLYLYDAEKHTLILVLKEDIRKVVGIQDFTQVAPVNLIFVADLSLATGDEAGKIFYSTVDTGFVSQNVYLYCASEGLATVVLGWVDKKALAKAMKLDNTKRIVLTQPVGYPK